MNRLRPKSALDQRARKRVIVTLHDGSSFDGVLWESDMFVWVLRNASLLDTTGDRVGAAPIDGEVVILTENIAFAQCP